LAWGLAALALVAGAAGLWRGRAPSAAPELVRFAISPPPGLHFVDVVQLSSDGRRLLCRVMDSSGVASVWVRDLSSLTMRRLPGTDGSRYPFWSPDGREVAFCADRKLKRESAEGGPAQTICDSGSVLGGAWGRDGTILFTPAFGAPIVAVPASGGTPKPVTALDAASGEVAHMFPDFLPDGRHFVFVARHLDPEKTEIRLGSLDDPKSLPLFHADSAAVYAAPGYLLFARDNAVLAQPFDTSALRLTGEARTAFDDVQHGTEENHLAASVAAGRFAYLRWPLRRRLVWVDRRGRELGTLGEAAAYEDVRLSADGKRVAVSRRDTERGQNLDIWVLDTSRGTASRVTSDRTDEFAPDWIGKSDRLLFVSDRGGSGFYDLYEVSSSGGAVKSLLTTHLDKTQPTVSRDGKTVLFVVTEEGRYRRARLPLDGSTEPKFVGAASRFSEGYPGISPDGKWTSYSSDDSGSSEIYVEPFDGGPRRQVSVAGGLAPTWRADGRELFYLSRDGMLMAVPFRDAGGGRFESGEPQTLFAAQLFTDADFQFYRHSYDVAPDGERFLIIRQAPDSGPKDAVVVLNWERILAQKGTP